MTRRRQGQGRLIRWSAAGYLPWSCSQSPSVRPRHYCGSYSSLAPLLLLIKIPSCVVFSSSPPGFTGRSSCLPSSLTTSRRYILPQLPNLRSSVLENKHPWTLQFESCSLFGLCAGVLKHIPSITVKAVGLQFTTVRETTWESMEQWWTIFPLRGIWQLIQGGTKEPIRTSEEPQASLASMAMILQ